jgi:hypothetical protein
VVCGAYVFHGTVLCHLILISRDFSSLTDQKKKCPGVQINNGVTNSSNTSHSAGEIVMFSCNTGYEIVGNMIINCVRSGQDVMWNGDPPGCYNIGNE